MRTRTLLLLPALLAASIGSTLAAPNFVGQTGTIVTPNALLLQPGEFNAAYHYLDKEVFGGGDSLSIFSAGYGFTSRLEGSVALVDAEDSEFLVNGKFLLLPELQNRPSLVIGVVDLLDELEKDPGFYFLIGKNLTWASPEVAAETEGRVLRAYIGAGTGPYEGLLAGLSYIVTPQLNLLAEFAPEGPLTGRDDSFNVGFRYAISPQIRLTGALIDFDNFGFGISFTSGLR